MATPAQLIRMAQKNSLLRRMHKTMQQNVQMDDIPLARPMPTNHAGYSSLMRSHDRMRTRHLSKNGT